MAAKNCKVCDEAQSKYKCPTCLTPYCSLACFKKHKEIPCEKAESNAKKIDCPISTNNEKPCYVDEPTELLEDSKLQSLASSDEIREALKDERIQKLIYGIDSSEDAENELDKAMEDESFRIFAEKILSAMGS